MLRWKSRCFSISLLVVVLSDEAPTIATALKSMGYATGQFGKNHLGDRNQFPGD
jgi:arylsulfatase A-like enzyme